MSSTSDHAPDLTRELGLALHEGTERLAYHGEIPRVRDLRPLLPLALTGAVTAAAAVAVVGVSPAGHRDGPGGTVASPGVATPTARGTVTETIRLAGLRVTYARAAGESVPRFAAISHEERPPGARRVQVDGPALGWVGRDPATHRMVLWLRPLHGSRLALERLHSAPGRLISIDELRVLDPTRRHH